MIEWAPKEQGLIEMARRLRRPPPAALENAPLLGEPDQHLWDAFSELSTCRAHEGGPIPWTAINQYILTFDIDDPDDLNSRECFEGIIREIDAGYLEFLTERRKANEGKPLNGDKGTSNVRKLGRSNPRTR